jgi:hypothetical protein
VTRNVTPEPLSWELVSGRGDPAQRYRIYRLCQCPVCEGKRLVDGEWCPDCRGEGRIRELVATAGTPEAIGVALVTLGREGEWDDCPIGLLNIEGEIGHKWIFRPWLPSPRNVSDAGRMLRTARKP